MRITTSLILVLFFLFGCSNSSNNEEKERDSQTIKLNSDKSEFLTNDHWPEQVLKMAEGIWIKEGSGNQKDSLIINGDTLIDHDNNLYIIKIIKDSTWTTYQILDSIERTKWKPLIGLRNLHKVSSDSLIFWNWRNGKKQYSYYTRKKQMPTKKTRH